METRELGLVVEGVDVTDRARTVDHEHLFGGGSGVRLTRRVWFVRVDDWTNGLFPAHGLGLRREQSIEREHLCEGHPTHRHPGGAHEVATPQQRASDRGKLFFGGDHLG